MERYGGVIGDLYRIGIAVRDLDAASEQVSRLLGASPSLTFENPRQSVRCAWFPMGSCILELIQSTSPDGKVARFIEKRGEGLYLVGLQTADLEAASRTIVERGGELAMPEAAPFVHGGSHNFIHPRSLCGVLVELVGDGRSADRAR